MTFRLGSGQRHARPPHPHPQLPLSSGRLSVSQHSREADPGQHCMSFALRHLTAAPQTPALSTHPPPPPMRTGPQCWVGGVGSMPGAPGINSRHVWSRHNLPRTPGPAGSWEPKAPEMKALFLPIALSLLAALRAQDPPSCPLEPQQVSLCGGEGSDPWGPRDQARLRRWALALGSPQEGVGEQGSLCSTLSQAPAQPRAAGGAAPAQGPGKRLLGPPTAGCALCREDVLGVEPAPQRRWASCLCLAPGALYAGLFWPTPGVQMCWSPACPGGGGWWVPPAGGSRPRLAQIAGTWYVKAVVNDKNMPKEIRLRKASPLTLTALGSGDLEVRFTFMCVLPPPTSPHHRPAVPSPPLPLNGPRVAWGQPLRTPLPTPGQGAC